MIKKNIEIENFVKKILNEEKKENKFVPGKTLIPPSGKLIGHEEIKNMVEASFDGWLTTGRFNSQFQADLSKFLKVKHLITVNSGSSANLVAFSSLTSHLHKERAIKPGDEIISVAAGFPTTVNPIYHSNSCISCGGAPCSTSTLLPFARLSLRVEVRSSSA